jgi:hypothetical protein
MKTIFADSEREDFHMRKMLALLVVTGVLLGVVGTAFAGENGTIWPTSSTKSSKVKLMENGSIWPF